MITRMKAQILQDIEYAAVGERKLLLDLHLPQSDAAPPVIVFIHGGGWQTGDKVSSFHGEPLVEHGYAVASVGYRLSGEARWPAQIHDCKAAVRFLRANAERWGADASRMGAWGVSAGGHLAALLGVTGRSRQFEGDLGEHTDTSSEIQAVCSFFGPMDIAGTVVQRSPDWMTAADSSVGKLIGGAPREHKDKLEDASPVQRVSSDSPPFLLLHGDSDQLVPPNQSEVMHDALRKAGVESERIIIQKMGHGWSGMGEQARPSRIFEPVKRFFDRHLKARAG
jgi:acetyl esterase/lipase